MTPLKNCCRKIIDSILEGKIKSRSKLNYFKKLYCKEYRISLPTNPKIMSFASKSEIQKITPILLKKPVRTLSGVSPVAVMTSPEKCPHGKCIMCPGDLNRAPQSYTGDEPAAMRGIHHNFDPFRQTAARLKQLELSGHCCDKTELIIMGGTFTAREKQYQEWFVKRCFDALNEKTSGDLETAKTLNETAKHRCVGLTVESRPDYLMKKQINEILKLGATRVEMGVQSLDDKSLEFIERGHGVKEVIDSTALLKDSAFKVTYHMMPGLPLSNQKKDIAGFKKLFSDHRFRPDGLKLYPCMVLEGTKLFELWKNKKYNPYTSEEAATIIAEMKKFVPEYCRIHRVQRDIPVGRIAAGVDKSNLRQLAQKELDKHGRKCRCIRCREAGLGAYRGKIKVDPKTAELRRLDYKASNGKEVFLSFVEPENDLLFAFLRLRNPSHPFREELIDSALVRELHVYSRELPIGGKSTESHQHKGFGKALLAEAEKIAFEEFGFNNLSIISGVGAREYYRKAGYSKNGAFMKKVLNKATSSTK